MSDDDEFRVMETTKPSQTYQTPAPQPFANQMAGQNGTQPVTAISHADMGMSMANLAASSMSNMPPNSTARIFNPQSPWAGYLPRQYYQQMPPRMFMQMQQMQQPFDLQQRMPVPITSLGPNPMVSTATSNIRGMPPQYFHTMHPGLFPVMTSMPQSMPGGIPMPEAMMQFQMQQQQQQQQQQQSLHQNGMSSRKQPRKKQVVAQEDEYARNVPSSQSTSKRSSSNKQSTQTSSRSTKSSRKAKKRAGQTSNKTSATPQTYRPAIQSIYHKVDGKFDSFAKKGVPGHFASADHVNVLDPPEPTMQDFSKEQLTKRLYQMRQFRRAALKRQLQSLRKTEQESRMSLEKNKKMLSTIVPQEDDAQAILTECQKTMQNCTKQSISCIKGLDLSLDLLDKMAKHDLRINDMSFDSKPDYYNLFHAEISTTFDIM